jgi:hypothetical protein
MPAKSSGVSIRGGSASIASSAGPQRHDPRHRPGRLAALVYGPADVDAADVQDAVRLVDVASLEREPLLRAEAGLYRRLRGPASDRCPDCRRRRKLEQRRHLRVGSAG